LNGSNWRKSTFSSGQGGQCVEVGQGGGILVRDTKANGTGPVLTLPPETWSAFLRGLQAPE
jgi:hypothetical protein